MHFSSYNWIYPCQRLENSDLNDVNITVNIITVSYDGVILLRLRLQSTEVFTYEIYNLKFLGCGIQWSKLKQGYY